MTSIAASVDFGAKARRNDMSGFLNGISTTNAPNNGVISKLRPAMYRGKAGSTDISPRIVSIDKTITCIAVCSDVVGYPILPANDASFVTTCTTLATYHLGQNVIFDLLNEPNFSGFYNGTQNQWFATWKKGHDAIRAVNPNAMIMGPSLSVYDLTIMTAFIAFCQANGLICNALAWHDFVDADPSVIPAHVAAVKAAVAASGPGIGVQKYYIPEYCRDTSWMFPGDCLNYLYYLQESGIDGACKATWLNLASADTSFDNSMGNLVDAATGAPHAVYYCYQWYAEMKRAQVKCTSANSYLAVLAGACPIEVLVGFGNSATATVDVPLTYNNLGAVGLSGTINADIYMVAPGVTGGETIVNAPTFIRTDALTVTSGVATHTLSGVNKHELFKIVLRP